MLLRLPYGSSSIPAEIPDSSPCEVLQVRYPEASLQPESLIQQCLDNPVASPRLDELLVRGRRVAIVVDDGTRATPTPMLLRLLLQRLSQLGVDERQISVVIAYGAHRRHDDETTAALLGPDVVSRVQVVHHDAHDERNLVNVGTTKRGTPVSLNRVVVEADLRILTGSVKPHNQAGYTGGGKSIVPGVAGIDTILANHSSANVSHQGRCWGSSMAPYPGRHQRSDREVCGAVLPHQRHPESREGDRGRGVRPSCRSSRTGRRHARLHVQSRYLRPCRRGDRRMSRSHRNQPLSDDECDVCPCACGEPRGEARRTHNRRLPMP